MGGSPAEDWPPPAERDPDAFYNVSKRPKGQPARVRIGAMKKEDYTPSEDDLKRAWRMARTHPAQRFRESDEVIDAEFYRAMDARDCQVASMIREALDRWEADGDDERLVNEILDPWVISILGKNV